MYRKLAILAVTGVVVAACSDSNTPSGPPRLAPIAQATGGIQTQLVPNEYIVALRSSQVGRAQLGTVAQSIAAATGADVLAVFGAAINGFAVYADPAEIAAIRANPAVEYVEQVQVYRAIATQQPTPSWGLDRVDQRNLPLDNSFTYPTGGATVHIYIIDTGILSAHTDFTGRMGAGANFIAQAAPLGDCNGHGTHVAGTAGGTTYGIMKTATMHAVRVLDCGGSGTTTTVVNGINWVINNAIQPAVSNMSIGGPISTTIDNATNNMVAAGVVSPVAAGNSNTNACNSSPSRAVSAITVGATRITDARASFSNFGTCLDIFAPGENIKSDWIGSNTATNTISGTSMASPHVAGAAALYRSFNPTHTATQVANALTSNATTGKVTNPGTGSPNLLLYMGFIGGGPPNQNPVANFTYSCLPKVPPPGFRCDLDGSSSSDPDGSVTAWSWTSPGKPTKSGVTSFYAFPGAGTYSVTLTVTDNRGGTNSLTRSIVVGAPPPNQDPVADFTYNCVPRTPNVGSDCTFDGSSSSDPDGTIVSYAWSATGRVNKSGVSATYPFPTGSRPQVTLTVTDNLGATNSKTVTVIVP
ncbi:MAG: S8 family serine peptidase [Gemmatimonadaceae bacterium]